MVTMGVFLFQGKTHVLESGIEPGTSWLLVRSCDHQATRLVGVTNLTFKKSSQSWGRKGARDGKIREGKATEHTED
jgi:hypothetical protein